MDGAKLLASLLRDSAVADELRNLIRCAVREELAVAMPSMNGDQDELLDVRNAAKLVGVSEAALRKKIARGSIPVIRHGRSIRIQRGSLLDMGTRVA